MRAATTPPLPSLSLRNAFQTSVLNAVSFLSLSLGNTRQERIFSVSCPNIYLCVEYSSDESRMGYDFNKLWLRGEEKRGRKRKEGERDYCKNYRVYKFVYELEGKKGISTVSLASKVSTSLSLSLETWNLKKERDLPEKSDLEQISTSLALQCLFKFAKRRKERPWTNNFFLSLFLSRFKFKWNYEKSYFRTEISTPV